MLLRVIVFTPPFAVSKVAVAVAASDGLDTTFKFTAPAVYSVPSVSMLTVAIPSLLTVKFFSE